MERQIHFYQHENLILQTHLQQAGRAVPLAPHFHEEYQVVVSQKMSDKYFYRGSSYIAPPNSVVVFQPGEVHSADGAFSNSQDITYRSLLIPTTFFVEAAPQTKSQNRSLPFFPNPIFSTPHISRRFLNLCELLEKKTFALEREYVLFETLSFLTAHHAKSAEQNSKRQTRKSIQLAVEYLNDNLAENVSLMTLAALADLSPFRFNRIFSQTLGLPPHAYQINLRINRAKSLLLEGTSLSEIAAMLGFYDQSHFTAHFKKIVGVTPFRYKAAKTS